MTAPAGPGPLRSLDSSFMVKVFCAFAVLALVSVAISFSGKWFGRSLALAGHTDDTTLHEVVIGNNVLVVPGNAIRFERSRHDGIATRLDLYLRWPDMQGYTAAARDDFNHAGSDRRIVFLAIERQSMSRDMSGRFDPIYASMIVRPGSAGPGGTTIYGFDPKSGYLNEVLAVAARGSEAPFVARCLSGDSAEESLAPCERDIVVGDGLSLSYRFPRELLGEWAALDRAVATKAAAYLKTAR